jgi:hypothetical protein
VRRALAALFRGAVSKDIVSRVWRKIKSDWEAWTARALAAEPIVRLILDGTVVRVRLDRKATAVSLLVVIGVREDGQKVMLIAGPANARTWHDMAVLAAPLRWPATAQGQKLRGGRHGSAWRRQDTGFDHWRPRRPHRPRGAAMRWTPKGYGGQRRPPDDVKREGWHEHGILVVSEDDRAVPAGQ